MADPRALALSAALLVGCAKSVIPEYELRRDQALAPARAVPAGWRGDATLRLAPPLVDALLAEGLSRSGTFERRLAIGRRAHISPALKLTGLTLGPPTSCTGCLGVDVALDGVGRWKIGRSAGERPVEGRITFDATVEATRAADGDWVVTLAPREIHEAEVALGGRTFKTVTRTANAVLGEWARENVFDGLAPIEIARFPDEGLPLRAARARAGQDGGVTLELLSEAPRVDLSGNPTLSGDETWALAISHEALLHLARAEAFRAGPVAMDVVPEPTGLRIEDGSFVMDLRLWRLKGRGWWRDVRIRGTWTRTALGFDLQAVEAEQIARSKGAGTVDPLAMLAEGRILQAVERGLTTTLPGGETGTLAGLPVKIDIAHIGGGRRRVTAAGRATVGERARRTRGTRGGGRR